MKVPTVKAQASASKLPAAKPPKAAAKPAPEVKSKKVSGAALPKVVAPKSKTTSAKAPVENPAVAPAPAPVVKPVKPKATPADSSSSPKTDPVSVSTKTKTVAAPVAPEIASMAKPPVVEADLSVTGVPVRSTRPSSRLAQLTVPSIAQSVASTAAKASFTQMTSVAMISSPLPSTIKKDSKLANNWKKKTIEELTDPEILAMADADYMNETQLAYFRLKLVTLKNSMLSNAGETTEHLREETVVVPDPADRATIEEEHALELRTRDRERKLLKKIEQSIVRVDSGDYGYCDETGEPIGVGRLLARPTANLSLEAQQRRELKQRMFGD